MSALPPSSTSPDRQGAHGAASSPGLRCAIGAYAVTFVVLAVTTRVAVLAPLTPYVAPLAFLYLPFVCDRRLTLPAVGLRRPRPRSAVAAGALSLTIMALFALFTWTQWGAWRPPAQGWATHAVQDLLFAAIPEEVFFRGWLLPLLAMRLPGALRLPGGLRLTSANALSSLAFALVHLAAIPAPGRLMVFFPGLWFGWLYERTGSLWWPVLWHTLANVAMAAAARGLGA